MYVLHVHSVTMSPKDLLLSLLLPGLGLVLLCGVGSTPSESKWHFSPLIKSGLPSARQRNAS